MSEYEAAISVLGIIVVVVAVLLVVFYLLGAIGLYGMGKRAGVKHSWLAFIPILNLYVVGKIIRKLKFFGITINRPEIFLPIATVVVSGLSPFDSLALVLQILLTVLLIFVQYNLIKLYRREEAGLYTVISVLVPFFYSILLFIFRNETPTYDEDDFDYDCSGYY